jgi:uncharacterized protein YcfJ
MLMKMFVLCGLSVALVGVLGPSRSDAQEAPPPYDVPRGDGYDDNVKFVWADVLRVDPIYEQIRNSRPREECYETEVEHRDTGNRTGGTVIGAIVGGVLGNTIGKGDGRKAATVAGAVAGGAIGNNIGGRNDRYYTDTETRCRTVHESIEERRIAGYDVQYRYRGDVFMSRLDYDPGERMRVRVSVTPAD